MTMVNQSHMGQGWRAPEMAEARTEATLAHPQWEREAYDGTHPAHNQRCEPCGVCWRSSGDFTVCWNCGQPPTHESKAYWPTTLRAPAVQNEYEYAGQPQTPAGGCGCDDHTVLMVAKLLADGWDLWSACLLVYRDTPERTTP